jgi:hypothetical protein
VIVMHRRGHILKLTAVSVLVVMALTGFKARGHGHRSSSHDGGGGGCSSSSQDHDSSSSTSGGGYGSGRHDYDDDDDYSGSTSSTSGTSGSSSGVTGRDGQVTLVSCASKKAPYATVEVHNPNRNFQTYTVEVSFYDARNKVLAEREQDVQVGRYSTATAKVPVGDAGLVGLVDHCEVVPYAPWAG